MFRALLTPLMLAVVCVASPAYSAEPAGAEKAVRVRDGAPAAASGFKAATEKPAYRVDEPIRLKVQSDRDVYVYVYTVDAASGNAWLLFPNRQNVDNRIAAQRLVKIPGSNVEFVSDQPGVEKLIVVASPKKIDIDPHKLTGRGDFPEAKTADLESSFESKGIRVRDSEAPQAEGVVVKRLDVKILAKGERSPDAAANAATVFINTSRASYQEGERMSIVYGASEPGWVHLFVVEPDGARSLLKRQKSRGDEQFRAVARAEAPLGKHYLVAVYSKSEDLDERVLDRVGEVRPNKDMLDKAIRLDGEDEGISLAVREVRIIR